MTAAVIAPWRHFFVTVSRVQRLSPTFVRVTCTGEDLEHVADNGYDQRIKLIFPLPGTGLADLPTGPDWYQRWRELPDERRNPVRTYTVRAVRAGMAELDVDLVRHGDVGPASRWAGTARPGDELVVIGPDARFPGEHGGLEYRPPAGTGRVLLAGDETAVPAICGILERLPPDLAGEALLEVPLAADTLEVPAPAGVRVRWLDRSDEAPGTQLVPAVRAAAGRLLSAGTPVAGADLADIDVDREILWEVPEQAAPTTGLYAWLAGEAAIIRALRRHLVAERGLDRRSVAFMGYWRLGRTEDG